MRKTWFFAPGAVTRHRRSLRRELWRYAHMAVLALFWAALIGVWLGAVS
jgi:hypothetical protein